MDSISPDRGMSTKTTGSFPRRSSRHQTKELTPENVGRGSTEVADTKKMGSSPSRGSTHQIEELTPEDIGCGSPKGSLSGPETSEKVAMPDENAMLGKVDINHDSAKNSNKSARKRKKVPPKPRGKRYPLRSSLNGVRVLRSMSNTKSKTPSEPVNTPITPVTKRRKRRREASRTANDDFSVIRKRVRYLLTRMNYEQSLIDAYSGEGWKGQSAEKIRPEKELDRAKSEILRCKLKIRDLFRHLDSLASEGRLQESLFDSDGEISSEDIFCAKCASKDLSSDNDIILCDGICDRGFHQKCLNPALLSEDIPLGDEGWLCPACDCKVDCIDLLNEFQERDISIEDSWEKVFPEAAAIANGDKQYDNLQSDDSEDGDYNPHVLEQEGNVEDHEEESDSTSSSEKSDALIHEKEDNNLKLSSDDSEDDEYDPDAPDLDKNVQKEASSSDESDFTSDSDEFCAELSKTSGARKKSLSSLPNLKPVDQSLEGKCTGNKNESLLDSELLSASEPGLDKENILLVSRRRQLERLDYNSLYKETYGNLSSDSSDDEDWSEVSTPGKGKKNGSRDAGSKEKSQIIKNRRNSIGSVGKHAKVGGVKKPDINLDTSIVNQGVPEQCCESKEPDSNGNMSPATASKRINKMISQKLLESFQENQYPTSEKKQSLAQEHGVTVRQVDKWFAGKRHKFRVSNKESSQAKVSSLHKDRTPIKADKSSTKPLEMMTPVSASEEHKERKSIQAGKPEVAAELGSSDGSSTKVKNNNSRQKAIERELSKMKRRKKM